MKVAILGGSFNPIHNGHIAIAKKVISEKLADEVWIMPCKNHSFDKILENSSNRKEMIKLAINNLPKIKICEFELKQEGKNYTSETLNELKKQYSHDFYLIIGADILQEITGWHNYPELSRKTKFLVFKRENYPLINPGINIISIIDLEEMHISSTKVRELIKQKKDIYNLVPKAVEEYICSNNLYNH